MVTRAGLRIQLRAVCPTDAELLPAFFAALSERSRYQRYSSPVRRLSPQMILQIARPDEHRAVSIAAVEIAARVTPGHGPERLVGLAQLFGPQGASRAEGALVVADPWQCRGLGSALIDSLVRAARRRRIGTIWGLVQHDNEAMIGLARKRGYAIVSGELGYEVVVGARGTD